MRYCILIILSLFTLACASWKRDQVEIGNENDAILNAIIDFHESGYYRTRKVFAVSSLQISDSLFGVSIFPYEQPLLINSRNHIDSYSKYFPSRYIIREDRLFYWIDSTYSLKVDLVENLARFNMIDSSNYKEIVHLPRFNADDHNLKSIHYQICISNLKKYKKVKSAIALDNVKPLKVNCR